MTNETDQNGNLLPDKERLNRYGKFLRSTSLDELLELFNILNGSMSFIGPRPLLVKYLPYYDERQIHRHDVRPGLTGLAQIHGRNATDWGTRLELDVVYTENLSFFGDLKILFGTILVVLKRKGISQAGQATMEGFIDYTTRKNHETDGH